MSTETGLDRPRRGRKKLADQVASLLEERILDGTFSPGEQLPIEADLADEMRVSRTVIRDAVRALAARRLLDVRQGLGTIVTVPSPSGHAEAALTFLLRSDCTVGDLWDARQLLDAEMTAAAIHTEHADWSAAERALEAFGAALEDARWDDAAEAHQAFHVGLMTATGNPVIELLLNPMHAIIMATSDAPAPPTGGAGWRREFALHPPILEAAMTRDEAAMRRAVALHYAYTSKPRFRAVRDSKLRDSPAARAALEQSRRAPRLTADGARKRAAD
jgi:DNA-binding FadR family transcriptional regulator